MWDKFKSWIWSALIQLISSWVFVLIALMTIGLSFLTGYLVLTKGLSAKDEVNILVGAYSSVMTQINALHLINSSLNTPIPGINQFKGGTS